MTSDGARPNWERADLEADAVSIRRPLGSTARKGSGRYGYRHRPQLPATTRLLRLRHGNTLADGTVAHARTTGWFMTFQDWDGLNNIGWHLLDAAIEWLSGR